ncbi:MAG: hypothetical protein IPL25_18875 [Saprospiraceae bacterium]|nr:hypothetical protein [Candidatus Vicinibacter affinis]
MAAFAIQRSKNWLAMFYNRIKAKMGRQKQLLRLQEKLRLFFIKMIKERVKFNPIPIEKYMDVFKENQIKKLKRQAKNLGLQIVEM